MSTSTKKKITYHKCAEVIVPDQLRLENLKMICRI